VRRLHPRLIAVAAVVFVSPAAAGQADAKPVGFDVTDRGGDAANPQLDLRAARATFDPATGVLEGGIALAAPPTSQVIEGAVVQLGRSVPGSGHCQPRYDVDINIPTADDIAAGLTLPYAQLYKGRSADPIGFLPASTDGANITFSSAAATPEVAQALKSQRFNCIDDVHTAVAGSFDTADTIEYQPLLSGPKPRCRLVKRTVRGGRSFPVRCRGAGRKVGVHIFPQRGRDFFTGSERVRNGRFRVPTTDSMRGKTVISLWTHGTAFARFEVRIR
jgi:hypothetical protein